MVFRTCGRSTTSTAASSVATRQLRLVCAVALWSLTVLLLGSSTSVFVVAFVVDHHHHHRARGCHDHHGSLSSSLRIPITPYFRTQQQVRSLSHDNNEYPQQQQQRERRQDTNWIERSSSGSNNNKNELDQKYKKDLRTSTAELEYFDLGLSGDTWQIGPLGKRVYETFLARTVAATTTSPPDLLKVLAMDVTARQAVEAVLKQNGWALATTRPDEPWCDRVESIRFGTTGSNDRTTTSMRWWDSWNDAVPYWTPGQAFDFVARHVRACPRDDDDVSVEDVLWQYTLQSDSDGSSTGRTDAIDTGLAAWLLSNDDECESLADLAAETVRRTEQTPQTATTEEEAFAGWPQQRGYRVMAAWDLSALPHNRNHKQQHADHWLDSDPVMHVMGALVGHGCLIVDVTNGGQDMDAAQRLADMWKTTEAFFASDAVKEDGDSSSTNTSGPNQLLPAMSTAEETGSPYAKVGYASYDNGSMQFLETRLSRTTREILPSQVQSILGPDGCQSLQAAFDLLTTIGKGVVRVAVAASTLEAANCNPNAVPNDFDALLAADRVAEELLDDGLPLASKLEQSNEDLLQHTEGTVNMSPHRLCRYSNKGNEKESKDKTAESSREVFGAHTDSSFVTIVPVAAVSGLEVYDETAEQWYRPELAAKLHFAAQMDVEEGGDAIPWHARYVVIMPGEFLQILTRQEVLASVHRVVATRNRRSRFSAPILLRGRSGTVLDAERYWGKASTPLLKECAGKTMEEIHNAMQPSSKQ